MVPKWKGKTYEEIFGKEKAKEWKTNIGKAHIGKTSPFKGRTYENIYGNQKAKNIKQKMSNISKGRKGWNKGKTLSEEHKRNLSLALKGKTFEEIFGKEKADEMKRNLSLLNKGKKLSEETKDKLRQYTGPKASNWQGGKSFEPYTFDFNERFKEMIRERDNRCCVICNKTEEQKGRKLTAHHVDYSKANSFPQNCVSLCTDCHAKTNFNRVHWKTFFQSLLKERYNYEYTEDQKIILDFNKKEVIGIFEDDGQEYDDGPDQEGLAC